MCVCNPVSYLVAAPRMSSALKLAGKSYADVQIGPIDADDRSVLKHSNIASGYLWV